MNAFYGDERTALFIDGPNLHSAARHLGFDIDYRCLKQYFQARSRLIRAMYYTAILEGQEYSPIRPLVDWLDYNGFTTVTKTAREYTDPAGRRRIKGNIDIPLAIDMLEMSGSLDHAVLLSGDGDYRPLVETVQRKGVRVSVVSTIRTQPPMLADSLRRQADIFIELREIADDISRNPADRPARLEPRADDLDDEADTK